VEDTPHSIVGARFRTPELTILRVMYKISCQCAVCSCYSH